MYMLILILQQQIEVKSIPRIFFLGFYYWDLLSVMLSEVVFNYNFVFFFENLHLSQHKENNRCV